MQLLNSSSASGYPCPRTDVPDSVYEPWEMTERERELCTKCVNLIQGHIDKVSRHKVCKCTL